MPPPPPPESITLRIKVPPGHLVLPSAADGSQQDSFDLGSHPVSTPVGAVRQIIASHIPSHPPPEQLRLLYGGRALVDNAQSLADALNTKRDPTQTEYVIHLLVKAEGMNSTPPIHTHWGTSHLGGRATSSTPPILAQPRQHPNGTPVQNLQNAANTYPPQMLGHAPPPPVLGETQQGGPPQQASPNPQPPGPHPQSTPTNAQQQGRPVSGQGVHVQGVRPDGARFEIHQQTINIPNMTHGQAGFGQPAFGHMQLPPFGFPGMPHGMGAPPPHFQNPNHIHGMPQHFPGMPPQFPGVPQQFPAIPPQFTAAIPGMAPPQGPHVTIPRAGRTALELRRDDMSEMRSLLEGLRDSGGTQSEADRQRINELEQRLQRVANYIDPFGLGGRTAAAPGSTGRRSAPPNANATVTVPTTSSQPREANQNQVTAHLLSGPNGPHAILFSPQHGVYHGSFPRAAPPAPTSTTNIQPHPQQPNQQFQQARPLPGPNNAPNGAIAIAQAQQLAINLREAQQHPAAQAVGAGGLQPEPLGPFQNLGAHAWLFLRVLIFAYFFMGTNMGYWRPMVLAAVGALFWAIRMGVLGDGAGVRAWWEGVVGAPERRQQAQGEGDGVDGAGQQEQEQDGRQRRQQRGGVAGMPTPEQLAQRIIAEQEARQRERWGWLRERVRPVERAAALFVASLWPGIGEAQVNEQRRIREQAEAEAEVEARRVREAADAQTEAEASRATEAAAAKEERDQVESPEMKIRREHREAAGEEGRLYNEADAQANTAEAAEEEAAEQAATDREAEAENRPARLPAARD